MPIQNWIRASIYKCQLSKLATPPFKPSMTIIYTKNWSGVPPSPSIYEWTSDGQCLYWIRSTFCLIKTIRRFDAARHCR